MTEITHALIIDAPFDFTGYLALLIPIIAVSLPAIIILIVFVYESRNKKMKYDTIIEVSKNISDPEEVRDLLESLQDKKKSPIDLRRSGIITIFIGAGLFMLGWIAIGEILKGVGVLVGLIGVGQMIAGYIYPNQTEEINKAVEDFEKKYLGPITNENYLSLIFLAGTPAQTSPGGIFVYFGTIALEATTAPSPTLHPGLI